MSESKKMYYYSALRPAPYVPQDMTRKIEKIYKLQAVEGGSIAPVFTGEIDIDKAIQIASIDAGLAPLLSMYEKTGDLTLFQKRKGYNVDITAMPKNIHELKRDLDLSTTIVSARLKKDAQTKLNAEKAEKEKITNEK